MGREKQVERKKINEERWRKRESSESDIGNFSITPQKLLIVSFLLKIQTLHMHLCVNLSIIAVDCSSRFKSAIVCYSLKPYKLQADVKNSWLVVAEKSSFCCFDSAGPQPSSVAADGSPLLGSISTSFTVPCCCCRCFMRFEVVFLAVERVLVPPGHNLYLTFIFLSSLLLISLK